jgi:predicted cupin superfamily sugar epimerase
MVEPIPASAHPPAAARRSALTSIYFLLQEGDFSAFHRVASDEVWHLIAGGPLELHRITADGQHALDLLAATEDLAFHPARGWNPQAVVPAGQLQAARPAPGAHYALCTCLVAPGFDFADFAMPSRQELLTLHPHLAAIITQLTR